MADSEGNCLSIKTSAPAKVILFGEHSVVYGYPAVAASIDRRTSVHLQLNNSNEFKVTCVTLGLSHTDNLPLREPETVIPGLNSEQRRTIACIYEIYSSTSNLKGFGIDLSITSNFPCGAGLGSSASFSVSVTAAFLAADSITKDKSIFSDGGKYLVDDSFLLEVEKRAHQSEKLFHGNPSGIDTTVCCYGGIVRFKKGEDTKKISEHLTMKVGIVDSKVKRDAKKLVDMVREEKDKADNEITNILHLMGKVADSAVDEIKTPTSDQVLLGLVARNHSLLCQLGVSHPTLDRMKLAVTNLGVGFKITGAGGGGNGLVFIPSKSSIEDVKSCLKKCGFPIDIVDVGVPGVDVVVLHNSL